MEAKELREVIVEYKKALGNFKQAVKLYEKWEDIYRAGIREVVEFVEAQRVAGKTLIEGIGFGVAVSDEAWQAFKKSKGIE